ncbi:MAG: amidohydrolase [Oscillospiraceae bacterium]
MSILIKNVTAVTMTDENPVIDNAYVAVKDNKISYVGVNEPNENFDIIIDGDKKVVMPGLVNAHAHVAMTLLRSYADDMSLHDWLFKKIIPYEDNLTPEMVYEGSTIGLKEMIESGTTCFNDMYFFQEETAKAARELGVRAVLNEGITDDVYDKKLQKTIDLIENIKNDGDMIKVGISPHAVYTCTPETLEKCAKYAYENDLNIHTHLSETTKENIDCIAEYGKTPTQLMLDVGLFEKNAIVAHCVALTHKDVEILSKNNVTVVHNPISNLKLASGVADVPELVKNGVNVALGTDGAASNNNLDLFEEIKMTGILHKGIKKDPTILPAFEVLKMATVNGAVALGYDNLGVIKEG